MAGGAISTSRVYDNLGRIESITSTASGTLQSDGFVFDPDGNLMQRSWIDSSNGSHTESFVYDNLSRLKAANGPVSKTFGYDDLGNLSSKSDFGTYSYVPGTHRVNYVVQNSTQSPNFSYDADGSLLSGNGVTATWMSFGSASSIQRGTAKDAFVYGPEHQRVQETASVSGTTSSTTLYVSDEFEVVTTTSTGITEYHTYINVMGRRVAMLIDRGNDTSAWRYFYQDHLGSVELVTDQTGAVVERLSYDGWGKRRNADGTDATSPITALDTRGFTDHEMMDNLQLVNMNGRLYDPSLGRFLSADPQIQSPDNLQNFNRYSYVLNNPLSMRDPTGFGWWSSFKKHWLRELIGLGVGLAAPEIGLAAFQEAGWTSLYDVPFDNFGGVIVNTTYASLSPAGSSIVGLAAGFTTGYITGGNPQSALVSSFAGGILGAVGGSNDPVALYSGHAAAGCITGSLSTGGCGRGAASSVFGEFATLSAETSGGFYQFSTTVVSGGVGSVITGGRFVDGAKTAAFNYVFNWCAHNLNCIYAAGRAVGNIGGGIASALGGAGLCVTVVGCAAGVSAMYVGAGNASQGVDWIFWGTENYAGRNPTKDMAVNLVNNAGGNGEVAWTFFELGSAGAVLGSPTKVQETWMMLGKDGQFARFTNLSGLPVLVENWKTTDFPELRLVLPLFSAIGNGATTLWHHMFTQTNEDKQ
jgi:RHS repeat-associated protein